MGKISTPHQAVHNVVVISILLSEMVKEHFRKQNTEYFNIMNSLMWRRYLAHPMSEFLGTAVIVIVLWYGGKLVLSSESNLSPSEFIIYLVFFYSIINPAKSFTTAFY